MNLIFKHIFFVVMICFPLVACNDDDPKNNNEDSSIIGVWVSDKLPLYDDDVVIGDVVAYMWYQQNGKFIEADCLRSSETGKEWIELSENGSWSVEDGILTQTTNFGDDEDFDTNVFKYKIKGTSLLLNYNLNGKETTSKLKRSTVEVIQNIINEKKKPKGED